MTDGVLRLIVADDHPLVREGICQLLQIDPQLIVVGRAGDVTELMQAVAAEEVDVVITDIRMPPSHHCEGIEAAQRIRSEHPNVGVVVLSAYVDESYARSLFSDGTQGLAYLLKDRVGDRDELVRAIRAVAAGDSVIDPQVVESMVRRRAMRGQSGLEELTPREHAVLDQMAAGRSNPAIATALYLSVSAVEKHITSIFAKLGLTEEPSVHRRVAAVLAHLAGT